MAIIRAAGGLLWRDEGGSRRLAVIHRPRREDWSLPKGKLEDGEGWEEAALREVREETGCEACLLSFAGVAYYVPRGAPKVVLYWNMAVVREGALDAPGEVDEIAWLPPDEALKRLDHQSEREILEQALRLRAPGERAAGACGRAASARVARGALAAGALAAVAALATWLAPAGSRWPIVAAGAIGALGGAAITGSWRARDETAKSCRRARREMAPAPRA
jgi:8-oxo-dGTP diphosphatase